MTSAGSQRLVAQTSGGPVAVGICWNLGMAVEVRPLACLFRWRGPVPALVDPKITSPNALQAASPVGSFGETVAPDRCLRSICLASGRFQNLGRQSRLANGPLVWADSARGCGPAADTRRRRHGVGVQSCSRDSFSVAYFSCVDSRGRSGSGQIVTAAESRRQCDSSCSLPSSLPVVAVQSIARDSVAGRLPPPRFVRLL